jgi:hypothetical protein
MANIMANWTGYIPEQGYTLYKTAGVWDDWTYGALGSYAFTIEMGDEFQPPASEIINQSKLVLSSELFLIKTTDDLHLKEPVVNITNDPLSQVAPNTPTVVRAQVEAPNGLEEEGTVTLVYSRSGGTSWSEMPMTAGDNATTYTANIPGLRAGACAIYYVKVTDNNGITRTGPFSAPYVVFEVQARNGILEQVGDVGLIAILAGVAVAGVLYYLRVWRPGHLRGHGAFHDEAPYAEDAAGRPRLQEFLARVRSSRGR